MLLKYKRIANDTSQDFSNPYANPIGTAMDIQNERPANAAFNPMISLG